MNRRFQEFGTPSQQCQILSHGLTLCYEADIPEEELPRSAEAEERVIKEKQASRYRH